MRYASVALRFCLLPVLCSLLPGRFCCVTNDLNWHSLTLTLALTLTAKPLASSDPDRDPN